MRRDGRSRWIPALLLVGCWHGSTSSPSEPATVRAEEPTPRPVARRPAATPYRDVAGTWKGVGYQYNTRGRWDLEMTLFARGNIGDVIGSIIYENGNCTAELIRQPERDGDTLAMTEKLVTGHGQCVDGGTIRIPRRPLGHELDWRWDFANGIEGAMSTVRRD